MQITRTPTVRLLPATEADTTFLLSLRRITMQPHRVAAGIPEDEDEIYSKVRKDFDVASLITHNNDPIGVFKARKDTSAWSISQIQLLPNWQGRGIGTELVSQFVNEARSNGKSVQLSVLKSNPARSLYERIGFKVISESKHGVTLRAEA
jgi:ribosomal protein S18 acetylase RimI-like enzyme